MKVRCLLYSGVAGQHRVADRALLSATAQVCTKETASGMPVGSSMRLVCSGIEEKDTLTHKVKLH